MGHEVPSLDPRGQIAFWMRFARRMGLIALTEAALIVFLIFAFLESRK